MRKSASLTSFCSTRSANKLMGKYGRPKLSEEDRRSITLPVRLNDDELAVIQAKASEAGISPSAWMRLAAQERNPPPRCRVLPELNHEAWKELSQVSRDLRNAVRKFKSGSDSELGALVEQMRRELAAVRHQLIGSKI